MSVGLVYRSVHNLFLSLYLEMRSESTLRLNRFNESKYSIFSLKRIRDAMPPRQGEHIINVAYNEGYIWINELGMKFIKNREILDSIFTF